VDVGLVFFVEVADEVDVGEGFAFEGGEAAGGGHVVFGERGDGGGEALVGGIGVLEHVADGPILVLLIDPMVDLVVLGQMIWPGGGPGLPRRAQQLRSG
jgi:hypothetical protein